MKKRIMSVILAVALTASLAACSSKPAETQPAAPAAPAATQAAAPAAPAATEAPAPAETEAPKKEWKNVFLNISTSTSGGTFYIVGGKIADMINNYIDGVQATAEVTAGGVENARLIKGKETDLVFMPGDTLYKATHGEGEFTDDGVIDIQIIAALYDSPLQIVTLESTGIKTIADLKGKKVSIGAPGSSTAVRAEIVLNAHGLTLDDIVVDTTTSGEASTQLNDGVIDAAFFASGAPASAIMDLSVKNQIVMLPITDEGLAKIQEEYPYLHAFNVDADIYPNVPAFRCIASSANLCASPEMDEDLVYEITKMLFEKIDEFGEVHKSVKNEFNIKNAVSETGLANYNPGAIRYYKEVGAWNN